MFEGDTMFKNNHEFLDFTKQKEVSRLKDIYLTDLEDALKYPTPVDYDPLGSDKIFQWLAYQVLSRGKVGDKCNEYNLENGKVVSWPIILDEFLPVNPTMGRIYVPKDKVKGYVFNTGNNIEVRFNLSTPHLTAKFESSKGLFETGRVEKINATEVAYQFKKIQVPWKTDANFLVEEPVDYLCFYFPMIR
jgi:hypothetical protein